MNIYRNVWIAAAAVLLAGQAMRAAEEKIWNPPSEKIDAQALVDEIMGKNPDVTVCAIHAVPPDARQNVIIASSIPERIGFPSDGLDIWSIEASSRGTNFTFSMHSKKNDVYWIHAPLRDKDGDVIADIVVKVKWKPGVPDDVPYKEIGDILKGVTFKFRSHHAMFNLPKVYKPEGKILAQQLVDETLAKHHLKMVVFHCTPPGGKLNCIVASSLAYRIGYRSQKYAQAVADAKVVIIESSPEEKSFEVCLPFTDSSDRLLGGTTIMFHLDPKISEQKYYQDAVKIRDEMKSKVANNDALFSRVN